jgi:hypothetical protein
LFSGAGNFVAKSEANCIIRQLQKLSATNNDNTVAITGEWVVVGGEMLEVSGPVGLAIRLCSCDKVSRKRLQLGTYF